MAMKYSASENNQEDQHTTHNEEYRMIRISRLALVVALFSLVGFGCSDGPESLTQSPEGRTPSQLACVEYTVG